MTLAPAEEAAAGGGLVHVRSIAKKLMAGFGPAMMQQIAKD
jgi:hypothetical protein